MLRKWVKEFAADPQHAFPGEGQMKPEQLEIERLRREVIKLKAERDILRNHPGAARPLWTSTSLTQYGLVVTPRVSRTASFQIPEWNHSLLQRVLCLL
jgi:hypothetical protein